MATDHSREALLAFLDYLGAKGLMKKGTVSARKAAVNALLGILPNEEAKDLSELDLDQLVQRFSNLKGSKFKPQSLRVYKSRLASALEDFRSYRADPLSFRPGLSPKERRPLGRTPQRAGNEEKAGSAHPPRPPKSTLLADELIFPIPIRDGVIVRIACIPSDLTLAEARKIANVVLALATKDEARD